MDRFDLPPSHRVRRGVDFRRAYDHGKSASDGRLVVYASANDLTHPRVGLSVSRRVGNAVRRNRWKRLLREAFRLHQHELPIGHDFVLIPRGNAPPRRDELAGSLVKLAGQAVRRLRKSSAPPGEAR